MLMAVALSATPLLHATTCILSLPSNFPRADSVIETISNLGGLGQASPTDKSTSGGNFWLESRYCV